MTSLSDPNDGSRFWSVSVGLRSPALIRILSVCSCSTWKTLLSPDLKKSILKVKGSHTVLNHTHKDYITKGQAATYFLYFNHHIFTYIITFFINIFETYYRKTSNCIINWIRFIFMTWKHSMIKKSMHQAALSIIMAWSLTWIVSLTGPLHQLQGGTKVLIIWLTNKNINQKALLVKDINKCRISIAHECAVYWIKCRSKVILTKIHLSKEWIINFKSILFSHNPCKFQLWKKLMNGMKFEFVSNC